MCHAAPARIDIEKVDFVSIPTRDIAASRRFYGDVLKRSREQLISAGVEFLGETVDTGVCHMAFFLDRVGNVLILHRGYC